jgi:hypothetical protein
VVVALTEVNATIIPSISFFDVNSSVCLMIIIMIHEAKTKLLRIMPYFSV